jgi:hypothetical protein
LNNFFDTNLCDKELELSKNEIKEHVKNKKENKKYFRNKYNIEIKL